MVNVQMPRFARLDEVFEFRTAGMSPPNRLIFGFGAVDQVGEEATKLTQGKVLLVTDETLEKLGVVEKVASELSSRRKGEGSR
jgi:alcohol dehydrogenase class IV